MLNSVVFWYLTRDRHKDGIGAGSYGYGGLKGGNHIYFERQKTGGSKVINSAQIVFETMDAANNFLDKYYKIFK